MRSGIGFFFAPEFSYRTISAFKNPVSDSTINSLEQFQKPQMGYSLGLVFKQRLLQKWWLESGFHFNMQTVDESFHPYQGVPVFDSVLAKPNSVRSKFHYAYLGIPVRLKWIEMKGKIGYTFFAGAMPVWLAYAFRRDYKNGNPVDNETVSISNNFDRFNLFVETGAGIILKATDNIDFELKPRFRIAILSPDKTYRMHLYSIGLDVLMNLNFNPRKK